MGGEERGKLMMISGGQRWKHDDVGDRGDGDDCVGEGERKNMVLRGIDDNEGDGRGGD